MSGPKNPTILPSLPGEFSFSTALELLKQGYAVRRKVWPKSQYAILTKNKKGIQIILYPIKKREFCPSQEELLAVDWQETTPILDNV